MVAEAGDLEATRRYVRGHHPAVLVLDLNMPGEATLPAIPGLRDEFPDTHIVVLTMQRDTAFAREALCGGAVGYVLKHAADTDLVEAVRRAAVGQTYLYRSSARGSPPSRRGRAARPTTSPSGRSRC